jgi:hypothetical protein
MPNPAAVQVRDRVPLRAESSEVTIGRLAQAAEVGVETVRYCERRRLLAVPHSSGADIDSAKTLDAESAISSGSVIECVSPW